MVLHESGEIYVYSSMPNETKNNNQLHESIKMPLTTRHGAGQLDQSSGMLANHQMDQIEEPYEPLERLPRFQIDLPSLKTKNLQQRPYAENLAFDEGIGMGLMLS